MHCACRRVLASSLMAWICAIRTLSSTLKPMARMGTALQRQVAVVFLLSREYHTVQAAHLYIWCLTFCIPIVCTATSAEAVFQFHAQVVLHWPEMTPRKYCHQSQCIGPHVVLVPVVRLAHGSAMWSCWHTSCSSCVANGGLAVAFSATWSYSYASPESWVAEAF